MFSYCNDLQEKIIQVINENPLPIDVKFFIIKDLYNTISNGYQSFLAQPEEDIKEKNKKPLKVLNHPQETMEVEIPLENIEMNEDMKDILDKGIKAKEKELKKSNKD